MNQKKIVSFLIVGAQKAGTSALDYYLRNHIEIQMALRKEVHFFDNEKIFKSKNIDYSEYHDYFDWSDATLLRGECTPNYMYWECSMRRIFLYNPKIKIIVCLRNPIDRAYSSWNMEKNRNNDHLSFIDALRQEKERCRSNLPFQNKNHSYIDRGYYSEQIRRIRRYFPTNQTLFIKYDDLLNNQNAVLNQISSFLNIGQFTLTEFVRVNSIQYTNQMNENDRAILKKIFKNEIKELEYMLGWDCKSWLQ
ncbi:sulfotransferase domain-containing protein [Marinicella rhabdoformis]|uniref:sulfotransferase domain-containing protein n=1 Tax=Marinicella rhabdoformis TaxID=2580566 RepID=UPI0012AEBBBE|nr:sulfotransferase domain-containing protein [Marinicella rhabdoformis]